MDFPSYPRLRLRGLLVLCACVFAVDLTTTAARAQDGSDSIAIGARSTAETDRTLAPYFWVKPSGVSGSSDTLKEGDTDVLPLKSTRVEATIAGVFAEVKVVQRYTNTGSVPLEAVYIFPGSTRAAVHGLTMQVGERRLEAKTKERSEARRTYEAAKEAGKTATLLEQHRPNVFQMNVANILPGDEITVELRYTELLVPQECVYEFVYPGVVGPRYSNKPAEGASGDQSWVENPYLKKGISNPVSYDVAVNLIAGLPLQDLKCRTHRTRIEYESEKAARIEMTDADAGNRDFIVQYRLAGAAIDSGLMIARGDTENFFLLMLQPPARPSLQQIPPREYVFVVDVSGSMHGFPLNTVKGLMSKLLGTLRPQDTFNLILFSGDSRVFRPASVAAHQANVTAATRLLDDQQGGGGTELLPALRTALAMRSDEARSRTFVVITDGYVDVEAEAYQLVRQNLGGANVFAFGIGSSVNRHLIEGLARAGHGEPFIVTDPEEAGEVAELFRRYVSTPVLTRVRVNFEGFDVYDVEPANAPDLMAERPLIVFGKWRGSAQGKVVVSGTTGGAAYRAEHDLTTANVLPGGEGLSRLWARSRIAELSDLANVQPGEEYKRQITQLGLTYNLLTRYTSFVAVDEIVRRAGAKLQTVKQPLPLPQGVENTAVGGGIGAAPEPSTYALIGVGVLVVVVALRRRRAKGGASATSDV